MEAVKPMLCYVRGKVLVPSPWRLLETIQGLLQDTNLVSGDGVDEAQQLLAVHSLLQVALKECVLHV